MRLVSLIPIGALLLTPALLEAQRSTPESKVWMSAGAGGGWTRVSCAICRAQRRLGPAAYVRVGANLGRGVHLGTEANVWTRDTEEGRDWTRALGAVVYLYPKPGGPWFVKSGVGYLGYGASDGLSNGSLGLQLGAGYEVRLAGRWYLSNHANLLASSFGSLRVGEDRLVGDVSVTMLQLGIGITRR
jgi:hypothetical protein